MFPRTYVVLVLAAALAGAFNQNPILTGLADTTFLSLGQNTRFEDARGTGEVLAYSGMVYDPYRHSILTFGGGHATEYFPNEVMQFRFDSLLWVNATHRDTCSLYDSVHALRNALGQNLGGLTFSDHIAPGSRHTYDGLLMLPDTAVMLVLQAQENKGGCMSDYNFTTFYKGGSAVFSLGLNDLKWSVGQVTGIAQCYSLSAPNPFDPGWVYTNSSYTCDDMYKVNWKTGERIRMARKEVGGSDMSMEFCPLDTCIYLFAEDGNIDRYDIAANTWTLLNPLGQRPNGYSIVTVYDTLNHVFACFSDSQFYYYNPLDNTWRHFNTKYPMGRTGHHHIYDPVDNVHILVAGVALYGSVWNTYVYKFTDHPGTVIGSTGASAVESAAPVAGLTGLVALPNPSSGSTILSMRGSTPDRFEIFDMRGVRIGQLACGKGCCSVVWNSAKVAAGVYLVKAHVGQKSLTTRILLSR